jgi:hypothetical protein
MEIRLNLLVLKMENGTYKNKDMKKILFFLLLISVTVTAQRSIPRGGAAGQVLKIANDGYSLKWIDANDSSSNAPLYFADVATTASLSATYSTNTLTATANGRIGAIDGVTLDSGETILYKNAVAQLQNGIYYVLDTGTVGTPYKLVRADNYNETSEVYPSQVNVINGTVNSGAYYLQTTFNPTIGTSAIVYSSKPAPSMVAGTGVTINTNTISIGQSVETTSNVQFRSLTTSGTQNAINLSHAGVNYITATNPAGYIGLGTTSQNNVLTITGTKAQIGGTSLDFTGGALNERLLTVASASTLTLSLANTYIVTGTVTVTGIADAGVFQTGAIRRLIFDGSLQLTNSSSFTLPTGANITTSAGDAATFVQTQYSPSVKWKCISYTRASGEALAASTSTIPYQFYMACTDETTAIAATDTSSITIYAPFNFTVTSVFGMLRDAQSSGSTFTFDIKKNNTTIFSTRPTIDNTEFTTLTAATAGVLSTTTFVAGDRIVIYRYQVGTGGKGFKVAINYTR